MQGLYGYLVKNFTGKKGQAGFTLIELLVVVTILGVLAAIVTLSLVGLTTNAEAKACQPGVQDSPGGARRLHGQQQQGHRHGWDRGEQHDRTAPALQPGSQRHQPDLYPKHSDPVRIHLEHQRTDHCHRCGLRRPSSAPWLHSLRISSTRGVEWRRQLAAPLRF